MEEVHKNQLAAVLKQPQNASEVLLCMRLAAVGHTDGQGGKVPSAMTV